MLGPMTIAILEASDRKILFGCISKIKESAIVQITIRNIDIIYSIFTLLMEKKTYDKVIVYAVKDRMSSPIYCQGAMFCLAIL